MYRFPQTLPTTVTLSSVNEFMRQNEKQPIEYRNTCGETGSGNAATTCNNSSLKVSQDVWPGETDQMEVV